MTECIVPKNAALAGSERNLIRQDLWDRYLRLAQQFSSELRGMLSNDPWDEGQNYTEEDITRWETSAQKISAEVDQLFSETDEFLKTPIPAGFKPKLPDDGAPF